MTRYMISTLPREGSRPRARRLLSRLAAVLVVGSLALGGASAASAVEEPDAPEPDAVVELSVSAGSGTAIDPGGPLVSTVTLANDTDTDLTAGSVSLQVNRSPLADSAALDAWLNDGTIAGSFTTIAVEPTPVVSDGAQAAVNVVVDAVDLGQLGPGVYALQARLSGATTTGVDGEPEPWNSSATTVLVVAASGARTTAVLVPITATPAEGGLLTSEELAVLTAEGGGLAGQLDAVAGTAAILAVDPAIIAAIRMLGISAPASATDWLNELEGLPNDVFALQFGDADATVQAHAGLPELLATPELTPLMQTADFPAGDESAADDPDQPEATASPEATPTPNPEPTLPDTATLSAIAGAQPGILWPRGDVSDDDLATFGGYLGDGVTTILPSTSVAGPAVSHGAVGARDVLVADAAASARLSAAVALTDGPEIDRELAAAAGHLFFTAAQSPTAILALDRSEIRSPAALRAALSTFASPGLTLDELLAAPPASVTLASDASTDRVPALEALLADEQRLTSFATILDEPGVLLAPTRIRVLRTIGVGLDEGEFSAAVSAQVERAQTTLDAVSIQQPKPVQLFTSAAPLPVWVRNDLPWNVNVSLYSTPSDPRLDIQPVTQVEALAASSTRVNVPIEARVASGDVRVTFRLTSPTGVAIGEPAVADVTLRADWEGIGLGILGGLIALLLVLGVVRTVRRRRADATAGGESDATGAVESDATGAVDTESKTQESDD
ncbi:DUF6049 family protein [Microbacterium alcoholitolerans]|uniref:DUF6049 family protein n=1 Tax=unclassified Microbacterium TaxID=2609290 RepID=UPI003D1661AC